jgi:hypothetical protein
MARTSTGSTMDVFFISIQLLNPVNNCLFGIPCNTQKTLDGPAAPAQPKHYAKQLREVAMKEKNLPLAIGLNIVLPGLGYMYMDKWIIGIFGCILVFGIYATTGTLFILPTWIGLNIIMGIDMAILSSKNKKEIAAATTMKCPKCAEVIKREAKVCRFCNTELSSM